MGPAISYCLRHWWIARPREAIYRVEEGAPKTYSWDKREKADPKQFMFDGLEEVTRSKAPGELDGQQFIVQNCKQCNLFLFDHSAAVTVDDCTDCSVFIGPSRGSVFIRDCQNCRVLVACQQFRIRDCKNLDVFLYCPTQPIIEESIHIRFGCFQLNYDPLLEQFQKARLSIFNNKWSEVHDFTPGAGHFSYLPEDTNITDYIPFERNDANPSDLSSSSETSAVPLTLGRRPRPKETPISFILCCSRMDLVEFRARCLRMTQEIYRNMEGECRLVSSREVRMQPQDAQRILGVASFNAQLSSGPAVGMEWSGPDANLICSELAKTQGWEEDIFTAEPTRSKEIIRQFHNFSDMVQGV